MLRTPRPPPRDPTQNRPTRAVLRTHGILINKHHLPQIEVISKLVQLTREKQCVIATSPPATGKTALLQLVEEKVRKNGGSAKRFLLSAYTTVKDIKLELKQLGISVCGHVDENVQNLWLLFDDAQNWYAEEYWPFWQFLIQFLAPNSFGRCYIVITATHNLSSLESPVQFESLVHFREEGLWVSKNKIEALFETHTGKSEATDAFFQLLKRVSQVGDGEYHIGVIIQGILFLQEQSRFNARSLVTLLRRCFRLPENLPKAGHAKLAEAVLCTTNRSIVSDPLLVPYVRAGILAPRKMKFSCLAAYCFYNECCSPHRSNLIPNSIEELERLSAASVLPERFHNKIDSRSAKRGRLKDPPVISLIDSDDDCSVKQEEEVDSPRTVVSRRLQSRTKRPRYSQDLLYRGQRRVPSSANVATASTNIASGDSHGDSHPNNKREGYETATIKSDCQNIQQFKFTPFEAYMCQFCGNEGMPDESQGGRRTSGCRITPAQHWIIRTGDVKGWGPFRRPHAPQYVCDPYFKYVKWNINCSNEADVFGYIMSRAILKQVGGDEKLGNILKFCRNQEKLVRFLEELESAIEAIAKGEYQRAAAYILWSKITTTGQWKSGGKFVHSHRPPKLDTIDGKRFVTFWDLNFKEKFGKILVDTNCENDRGKKHYLLCSPKQMCIPFVSILGIQRVKQIRKLVERVDFGAKVEDYKDLSIELFASYLIIAIVYRRLEPKKTIFGEVAFPTKLDEIYPFYEEEKQEEDEKEEDEDSVKNTDTKEQSKESELHCLFVKLIPDYGAEMAEILAEAKVKTVRRFLFKSKELDVFNSEEHSDLQLLGPVVNKFLCKAYDDDDSRTVDSFTNTELLKWALNEGRGKSQKKKKPMLPHEVLRVGNKKLQILRFEEKQHTALMNLTRENCIGKHSREGDVPDDHWSVGEAGNEKWFPNMSLPFGTPIEQCNGLGEVHKVYVTARRLLHGPVNNPDTLADKVAAFRAANQVSELGHVLAHLTELQGPKPLMAETLDVPDGESLEKLFLGKYWLEDNTQFVLAVHLHYPQSECYDDDIAEVMGGKDFIFLYQPQVGVVLPQHCSGIAMTGQNFQRCLEEYLECLNGDVEHLTAIERKQIADNWFGNFSRMIFPRRKSLNGHRQCRCRKHDVKSIVKLSLREGTLVPSAGGAPAQPPNNNNAENGDGNPPPPPTSDHNEDQEAEGSDGGQGFHVWV